jgi:predicted esterase
MNTKKFLLYSLIVSTFNVAIVGEQITKNHTITVFVHGTFPVRKILQYTPGRSLIYCPQGLSLANMLPKSYHFHKMAQACINLNPNLYSFDRFYTFGWKSEHVYDTTRMQAAKDLVQALQMLTNSYYLQHNVIPNVQLIGFSHGGNVVLHTANYLPLVIEGKKIDVTAWLFGTPVQQVNHHLVNSSNFTKIYSIYSKTDWLQRMDPQGLRDKKYRKNNFWSDRTFDVAHRCVQVNFTVNNKSICHSYYRCIFKYLPTIQQLIEQKAQDLTSGMIDINLQI